MSKSLAESAAEILKASMGSAGKESGNALGGVQDLGGQSVDTMPTDIGVGVGNKAAAGTPKAAAPAVAGKQEKSAAKNSAQDLGGATPTDDYSTNGQSGQNDEDESIGQNAVDGMNDHAGQDQDNNTDNLEIDAKTKKIKEEAELELTEEEIDAYLDSLSEEELAELAEQALEEEELDEQGLTGLTPELNKTKAPYPKKPQGVGSAPVVPGAKMPGKTVKEMVEENMGSCMEDVNALFNGESLSEDFRTKASTIFEAAVKSRVNTIVEQIVAKNEETISEEVEVIRAELSENIGTYLDYVVENWMQENAVAVDSGLRSEIAEDFIHGLKGLFEQHYIEIPEEKIQVAEELATQVVDLEQKLEEATTAVSEVQAALNESLKNENIRKICEGLTEVQIGKMKSLAEGVEFTTEGEYTEKLAVIRENYFPSKTVKVEKVNEQESQEPEVANVSGVMDYYVKAITKSLPK